LKITVRKVPDGTSKASAERITWLPFGTVMTRNAKGGGIACLSKGKDGEDVANSVCQQVRCYKQEQAVALDNSKAVDVTVPTSGNCDFCF
jgi:hypothetical protein